MGQRLGSKKREVEHQLLLVNPNKSLYVHLKPIKPNYSFFLKYLYSVKSRKIVF